MAKEYCSIRGNAGATLDVDVDVDYPIRPGSTSTEASSENLSLKLGSKSFSIEYDGDSSEASALMTTAQNENKMDRQKLTGSATDLTNVIHYIQSKQLDSDSGQYNGIQGWVGGSPHTSNEVSTYSNGDHSQSPSTCTMGTGTPVVKQPIMLQTLALPNERYRHEDFADDPLLSVSKESTTGDRSPSLYPNHMASPSNNSSPLGNRRHQFTVIPMKKIPEVDKKNSKRSGNEALGLVLSALYGKLLVVMGIAFPMSEVISTYIPPSFYDGFYLYLYFGSITFMICILGNILRQKATRSVRCTIRRINTMRTRVTSTNSGVAPDVTSNDPPDVSLDSEGSCSESPPLSRLSPTLPRMKIHGINGLDTLGSGSVIEPQPSVIAGAYCFQRIHFGSFYLRMGAVAFGIGSMIYSGLEFGQYFELEPDTKCHNILIALTPSVRMIFTFMQMYFIFLNSKMTVSKVRLGSQFGLMHMIGTNLCVWLNVLVQETRHEILQFYNPDNNTIMTNHGLSRSHYGGHGSSGSHGSHVPYNMYGSYGAPLAPETPDTTETPVIVRNVTTAAAKIISDFGEAIVHHRVKRGLKGPHSIYECRRTDIMGALVQNASPFLFPCTIEYSLICAAILYVMWKSIAKRQREFSRSQSTYNHHGDMHMFPGAKRSPHHYSVDCARANKGLFLGIFVLVLTIISLILFFVLITRPGYQALAILEVNITELVLYCTTTVAVLIGMCQVRELRYVRGRNLELDNILLIVAQTGSFIYNVFTIIGGHFTMKKNTVLVLMTALASLIQLLFQTLFILDASKRSAATADQARRKPGREVVTFLLVTNLAMWAINTLEKSRADSHPVQLRFYGVWAWTIITHISMPLAIFYRFHSTVCLCEIWKRAYKIKAGVVYH